MTPTFTQPTILVCCLISCFALHAQVRYSTINPNPFPQLNGSVTQNQFLAGDFDRDGDTDLVFWDGQADQYYQNNGSSFTLISNNASTPFAGVRMPVFGLDKTVMQDFDSDGDQDILYYDPIRQFHIYLSQIGTSYIQTSNPFANFVPGNDPALATMNQFFPGDFDNDGDIDMLYSTGSVVKYYKNNGDATFTHYDDLSQSPFSTIPVYALPIHGWNHALKADFDQDNDIDIYSFNPTTGMHYYLKQTAGNYTVATNPFPQIIDDINPSIGTTNRFQAGDFDADGDVDLVFWTAPVNQYYRNEGNGTFRFFADYMQTPFEGVNGPSYGLDQSQIIDLDNDGDLDVLSNEGPTFTVLKMNGAPPRVQQFSPTHTATNVPIQTNIVWQFASPIILGSGNVYIVKTSDGSIVETIPVPSAAISGSGTSTITIDPVSPLLPSTQYSVLFDRSVFKDAEGRVLGILNMEWRRSTANISTGFYSFTTISTTLPIKLKSFYGNKEHSGVRLHWETGVEINAKAFQIERSMNGLSFSAVGELPANGKPSSYTYLDRISTQMGWYYRLKLIDLDGSFMYSNTIRIDADPISGFSVYPNPVRVGQDITIRSPFDQGEIRLMNAEGKIIKQQRWRNGDLISTHGLSSDMYLMEFNTPNKKELVRILIN